MSSVAIVGACLVSCFVSIANPWFYTTTCGRNGCPACHKLTDRGRAEAVELGARAENNLRARRQPGSGPTPKKRWFRRCGGQLEDSDVQETRPPVAEPSFLGTAGVSTRTEPYHGTPPMRVDVPGAERGVSGGEAGVSLGVDVSHMAPTPRPVDAVVLDRANEGSAHDFGGGKEKERDDQKGDPEKVEDGSSRMTETTSRAARSPTRTAVSENQSGRAYPSRPLLDEAISWDRLNGVGKEDKKRKWWHMP